MSSVDPYHAPTSIENTPDEQPRSLDELARRTFFAWEKLRLIYVPILVVVTLAATSPGGFRQLTEIEFWVTSAVGAVFANLAFFAGPIVETYVLWLGYRQRMLRPLLFVAGTVFASMLAVITVVAMNLQTGPVAMSFQIGP